MDNSSDADNADRKRKRDEQEERNSANGESKEEEKEGPAVADRAGVVRRPDPPTDDEDDGKEGGWGSGPPQHALPTAPAPQTVGSNGAAPSPRAAAPPAAAGIRLSGITLAAAAAAPPRQVQVPASIAGLFGGTTAAASTQPNANALLLQYLALQQQQQQQPTHPVDPRNVFQVLELQNRQRQQQQTLQQSQEQQIRMLQQQLAHYQQLAASQELRLRQAGLTSPTLVPPPGNPPLSLSAINPAAPIPMAASSSITSTAAVAGRSPRRTVAASPRDVIRTANPKLTGRPPVVLYLDSDGETLSPYQCLARKHMELFEALPVDVEGGAQGRNKPIVIGQVGVRCKWCTHLPLKERLRASSYYPARLQGLYQAAQNILNGHLFKDCRSLPDSVREELTRLQTKKSGPGGGKHFWSEMAMKLGVFEDEHGLRFHPWSSASTSTAVTAIDTAARQQESPPAASRHHLPSPKSRHHKDPSPKKKEEGPPKEDPPSTSDEEGEEELEEALEEVPEKDNQPEVSPKKDNEQEMSPQKDNEQEVSPQKDNEPDVNAELKKVEVAIAEE